MRICDVNMMQKDIEKRTKEMRLHDICPAISRECDIWLESIGYYEKPAALKHHAYSTKDGALFEHSFAVALELEHMTQALELIWSRRESPMIVGLLHDVCKCDDYVKIDGAWQWNKDRMLDGHGDKSVMILTGHIELTQEEAYCIRFHMGAYTDKEEWPFYGKAVEKYANVLYTHTADMFASKVLDI